MKKVEMSTMSEFSVNKSVYKELVNPRHRAGELIRSGIIYPRTEKSRLIILKHSGFYPQMPGCQVDPGRFYLLINTSCVWDNG